MTRDTLQKKFGNNLRRIRKSKDISQVNLSIKCGFTVDYIGQLERGYINPTIATLNNIAYILNIDISDLVNDIKVKGIVETRRNKKK